MARKVSIGNPQIDNTFKTALSNKYVTGTALTVLSNNSFANDDLVIAGLIGEELAEISTINSLTGNTIINLVTAYKFAHPINTPISKVYYNKAQVEGRSSAAGTFALLETISLQWDKLNTVFFHDGGSDSWEYRFRYENTITGALSDYSPTVRGSGFSRNEVGYMLRQVRKISNDLDGEIAGDKAIIRFFNQGQDIIRGAKKDWWFLRVTHDPVPTVQGQMPYAIPTAVGALGNLDDVRYRRVNGNEDRTYTLRYLPEKEFDLKIQDNNRVNDDEAQCYTIVPPDTDSDAGYINIYPTPASGTNSILFRSYIALPDLNSVDDQTLVPIPSLLENYAIAQIERIRGNDAKADLYEGLFYGRQKVGRRVAEADVGINLLMKVDAARKSPAGQPMSVKRWLGRAGAQRYYGNSGGSNDYNREHYW